MPASSSSSSPSSASDTTAAAAATGHLSPLVAAAMAAAKASRLTENQRPQREGVEEVDDEIVLASGISSKRRRPLGSLLDPSSGAMEIHSMRVKPSAAFALYPGSRFVGEQRSDRASYTVSVQLQHVDMKESTLCGYLTISNLTDEFPEMTTYFEAEIVGPRYPFYTRKWGADEMVDRQHWMRFPSFHQYEPVFNRDDYVHSFENKDHIFMRWKGNVIL
jgi:hypothetical protein